MHYLKELGLFNTGPVQNFKLNAAFTEDGKPKPIVLVGANGSGKTIAISTIVDALHEFACEAGFKDVLPLQGTERSYWRYSGGGISRFGAEKYISWLTMGDADKKMQSWTYFDKTGDFSAEEWSSHVSASIPHHGVDLSSNKKVNLPMQENIVKQQLKNSAYCYFPSYRNETPFWINSNYKQEMLSEGKYLLNTQFGKKIECVESMHDNAIWLMDAVLDELARAHTERANAVAEFTQKIVSSSSESNNTNELLFKLWPSEKLSAFSNANYLLTTLLGYPAKFGVGLRNTYKRLFYSKNDGSQSLHVSHLSNGQSSLLNIFLTILRYSDHNNADKKLDEVEGVVIIDEADSGLHVNFQYETLPKLMKLMPKVQFILATHSPLLLLGLEKEYGSDGVQIIELPNGRECRAEDFSEFKAAYDALAESRKFREDFDKTLLEVSTKPLLMLEGDSDEILILAAWKKLRIEQPDFPFVMHDIKLGRTYLRTILKSIADEGFPSSRKVLALWDFDEAYEDWLTILNTKPKGQPSKYSLIENRSDSQGLVFRGLNDAPCYGALLPVPKFREQQAGERFAGKSQMPIELLFSDNELEKLNVIRTSVELGGGEIKKLIASDKIKLANDLSRLDAQAFEHFEPLLKMLEEFLLPSKGEST